MPAKHAAIRAAIRRILLRASLLAVVLWGSMLALHSHAQGANPEYALKAALIYKLLKFVDWPDQVFADATQPIALCVVGGDPFEGSLHALSSRQVHGRKLDVRIVGHAPEATACQAVFVVAGKPEQVDDHLKELAGRPILTIGDREGFADRGGVVEIAQRGSRLSFVINIDAARRAALRLAAPLLALATVVEDER